jgi:hypothetical protein
MRGAIPPLPQYAFMAWCLVKHRDSFTCTFIITVLQLGGGVGGFLTPQHEEPTLLQNVTQGLGIGGLCEHGNEPSGSIIEKFLSGWVTVSSSRMTLKLVPVGLMRSVSCHSGRIAPERN